MINSQPCVANGQTANSRHIGYTRRRFMEHFLYVEFSKKLAKKNIRP